MVELVDTQDLKSCGQQCPYGFDSRPKHRAEAGRKASWFPVRLSFCAQHTFKVNIPSRQQAQPDGCCGRGRCGYGCSVMVVRSWMFGHGCSVMDVWTWLFGHGCSVMAVATESHHIIISYRAPSPYFLLLHSLPRSLLHPLPHSKWTGSPYLAYSDRLHASAAFPAVFQ